MKVQQIDPRTLELPDVRIDSDFDADVLAMFAEDVQKSGIEQPLLVGESDGRLWVIDGRHRLEQALLQGIPTVPCIVRDMDLKAIQMRNLVSNRLRGRTKVSEEIKVVGDLYETHGATIEEIVEKTGMRRERLEGMLLIAQAHPAILQALDEEVIAFGHAIQLVRFARHEHQHRMLMSVRQHRPKIADLKIWVDEALVAIRELEEKQAGTRPKPRPAVATAACGCCQREFPLPQLSNVAMCRSCYALMISAYDEVQKLEAAAAKSAAVAAPEQVPPEPKGGAPP